MVEPPPPAIADANEADVNAVEPPLSINALALIVPPMDNACPSCAALCIPISPEPLIFIPTLLTNVLRGVIEKSPEAV